jgi:two-component sensor histidine kinase
MTGRYSLAYRRKILRSRLNIDSYQNSLFNRFLRSTQDEEKISKSDFIRYLERELEPHYRRSKSLTAGILFTIENHQLDIEVAQSLANTLSL